MALSPDDLEALREARRLLERRGLLVTLTDLVGKPLERGLALLPEGVAKRVHGIARRSLERALRTALTTLGRRPRKASSDRRHQPIDASR